MDIKDLCHLRLINCSELFQLAHLPTGDQTASTHATAIMELTVVPTMGSANVPQDGLAFTAHKVSEFCYLFLIYKSVTQFSFSIFTLYSLISSHAANCF